ncbi:alpha/beta fold hydrolase [Cupriavidus plantarum]|uniref:Pimeloyl-ACP methyl ester carboxylesterase n=1 Tax=Cupriavidus plantarum TaxID=942865 RepID=A0A316FJG8_9BURK|nr:alpha/beta hydrolase [Cupriavidus plantarum]PWK37750.1 pimeloyl-ACP methyl ester carboxylesterase [Cupriavidus plantarum]RLK45593.1 pimeloyl-ACP methyl ester carboxylesterase [Cupriavidus plantarum]CAG2128049.1 (E)-2-((N-methylformamido)methylene)succinate hydrolase [Cupriavidus plantarum]SMR66772.1 Pimeloyl-ACP methyl ester carboxylesterase [Cupriavidus plantarum]
MELTVLGQRAYAYTGGKPFNPALPCAVFVHGAQNDHTVWALQTRWFANHGFSVLAVDLPGHQRSAGAPLTSIEAMADWVMALVAAAGAAGPVLVFGHSMGSLIALECAARHAEAVRGIGLLATAYPMKVSEALLDAALHREEEAIAMVTQWSLSSLANKPSSPGPGAWMHGGSQRLMERVSRRNPEAHVFHTDFSACNAYAHGDEAAASVRCPVLFVTGTRDQMTSPKAAQALAGRIADASVVTVPCGHALMGERPDEVLDALGAFARRVIAA